MNKLRFFIVLLFIASFLQSNAQDTVVSVSELDVVQLSEIQYNWVSYRGKVNYRQEDENRAFQFFFVNRKDSIIYLNLHVSGVEIARMVGTPDSLTYVDKLNQEYYNGNWDLIANLTNVAFDFQMIQSLFNGTDFPNFDQSKESYQLLEKEAESSVFFQNRKHQKRDFTIFQELLVNNSHQIIENRIVDLFSMQEMEISYLNYAPIDSTYSFFNNMKIVIEDEEVVVDVELKGIKFNVPGPTGIKIPEKFTPIQFEER